MIVVMQKGASENQVERLRNFIHNAGMQTVLHESDARITVGVIGKNAALQEDMLMDFSGVEKVITCDKPYKLVSRTFKDEKTEITVNGAVIGGGEPVLIAGPCAVESEEQVMETARIVAAQGVRLMRGGAFKPRTSPYDFQGLGEDGLRLLQKAREETGVAIVTEVLDTTDLPLVAAYADVLQIGSRNMHSTKLLKSVGRTGKPVLLKRNMSSTLTEFLLSAEYIMAEGNHRVILCERGIRTPVEYSRNTLDLNIVPAVHRESHLPIIVDPSHGTGRTDLVEPMSLAALAAGADGLIIEVHPHPAQARSDADQALNPQQFAHLVRKVRQFIAWQKTVSGDSA